MFDNNQDGVITSCEVNKVFAKINKNFSDFPLSKNGIEFSEFLKLMTEEKSESEIEELKVAFKVFDLDGTGMISRQELESALKNLGENINDKNLNVILKTLDLDGDGKISFEGEFFSKPRPSHIHEKFIISKVYFKAIIAFKLICFFFDSMSTG